MAQAKKKRRRNRNDPDRAVKAAQREEAQRREREAKAAAAAAAQRKAAIRKRVKGLAVPALVGVGVIAAGYLVFKPAPEVTGVQQPPAIESVALAAGETFDYGTPTPTSGPYLEGDASCGIFTEPMALEDAVTALRVGAVVLWHQEGDTATAAALAALAGEYESHVVVSPNPDITDTVVATAWERLLAYDSPGDGVDEFLDIYRNRGSEDGDCPIG